MSIRRTMLMMGWLLVACAGISLLSCEHNTTPLQETPMPTLESLGTPGEPVATRAAQGNERAFITDEQGRALIFHGVNMTDDRRTNPPEFLAVKSDFERLASWGFNLIRLNLFWENLKPESGKYSQAYMSRLFKNVL